MITEESFIDFKCPHCGELVSFPQESAGFAQACPNCTQSLIVPEDGSEVGWQIPLPITTARLVIRRLEGRDWKDLLELVSDEDPSRYVHTLPLDEEGILHWLEADAHVKITTPDQMLHLGIEVQKGGKLIGYMRLQFTDPQRLQVHFSLFLDRKFQRQGFAQEAVVALLTFCFEGLKLHRAAASCDNKNTAACRLLEKAGLKREGEFVKDTWSDGEWLNTVWYALLEEDFAKSESPVT
jgi:Acetyltransferases, including N-acetylases of ribosomal proteins